MNIVEFTILALVAISMIVLGVVAFEAYQEGRDSRPAATKPSFCKHCGK